DVERVLAEGRDAVEQGARDTPLDLRRDVRRTRVEVAGALRSPIEASTWCLDAPGSWKVAVLVGVLAYGWGRDAAATNAGLVVTDDGDLLRLTPRGAAQPLWAARHLDCLILGNDRDLVERSFRLARGESDQDTLGGSSDYRDGVEARLRAFESTTGIRANALEFYLRPEQLFAVTGWGSGWPNPDHPDSMNQRVLAAFINLAGWRFASGAAVFDSTSNSLALLARVMLNQNEHTPFQAEFFRTEAQRRQEWLDPFLAMVPDDACALAAM